MTALGEVPHAAPAITNDSREFWTSGAEGKLRIFRCADCKHLIHPPVPVCRFCRSTNVAAQVVSGQGKLYSFTVNRHPWTDSFSGPYVLGLVELDEEPGVNVLTNIIDCPLEEIKIGMPVEVSFRQYRPFGEVWLPLFRPRR
jgi:uncharacterized OB-fold protein